MRWSPDLLTRTVAMHHVRAALRGAERSGLDAGPLLDRAGISTALLQVEQARVSTDRFAQLIKELWLALDDEFIGSGPGSCRIGTFAMMCHATVHCGRDLRMALHRAAEFYALFPSGPRFRLVEGAGDRADSRRGRAAGCRGRESGFDLRDRLRSVDRWDAAVHQFARSGGFRRARGLPGGHVR